MLPGSLAFQASPLHDGIQLWADLVFAKGHDSAAGSAAGSVPQQSRGSGVAHSSSAATSARDTTADLLLAAFVEADPRASSIEP